MAGKQVKRSLEMRGDAPPASSPVSQPSPVVVPLRVLADHGAVIVRGQVIDVLSRARLRERLDDAEGSWQSRRDPR